MNFVDWCKARGAAAYPTQPRLLAEFVTGNASMGADWAESVVNDVVALNLQVGLANPAATPAVIGALTSIRSIEPPRSWPREQWAHFHALPLTTQRYVLRREAERDKEVRKLQNEVANLKRQGNKEVSHGEVATA